jgi:sodium-dependent dicarboxylate transporter 2/3/5
MWLFPPKTKEVNLVIEGEWMKGSKANIAYIGFAATVILWMLGDLHGMNSEAVAMIPIALYSCTGVITISDMKKISWDVLWLMAGGIALGLGMDRTGLLQRMVTNIPFDALSPYLVVAVAGLFALCLSTFMSNTGAANLLMPLMAALAVGLKGVDALGGQLSILLVVTFSCSLAMSLPISTPPNALAMATGTVKTKDMAKAGILVGLVGYAMIFAMLWLGTLVGIF